MKLTITYCLLALVFIACKKAPPLPPETPADYETGMFILNEGLFEQNNASITFYNGTAFQQVFNSENGRGLGDTANDFERYTIGGNDYIIVAVDVSSQIEIIELKTMRSIAQISLFDGVNARSPRRVLVNGFKAYVCNFDGTIAVIDLLTNSIDSIIEVGANPDGMVLVNDFLYVANSGGLLFPVYDSTVTVIDIANNNVVETFETRINAANMVVDSENEIYLFSRGNYDDVAPAMLRINSSSNTIVETTEMEMSSPTVYGDWLYFYNSTVQAIQRYNLISEEFEGTTIISCTEYTTFYGFEIDKINERFICFDANGYTNSSTIRIYNFSGTLVETFQAGLNANSALVKN